MFTIYMEIFNWIVGVVTLHLAAGYFLIFINYSFHCLQTLLISWKQLHFLKACCKVFYTEMKPAFRPGLLFPSSKAILSSGPY